MTAVGSHLAETPTVVGVGLVVVALVWWRRRDLYAVGILVVGLTLEVTVFVTTTLFVDRARPPVHHLDAAPPTSSFPSGHTAAAIVLYIGLIIVLHRVWRRNADHDRRRRRPRARCRSSSALSRLYRGMHHPTDVLVGALLGAVALLIARASRSGARSLRSGRPDPVAPPASEERRHDVGRGRRPRTQAARRRAPRAPPDRSNDAASTTPIWHEVQKSKQAPKRVEKALAAGADLVFAWGGDGTVQRCIDAMAGSDATLAILPAGTANLLADEPRRSPPTSRPPSTSACTAPAAASTPGP